MRWRRRPVLSSGTATSASSAAAMSVAMTLALAASATTRPAALRITQVLSDARR
ncbi:MAG TPA: hypothetical protein PLI44_00695 [Chiayiivirga sp.]|nr:hypothetical protein [Chiayiivirga sp.]